MVLNSPYAGLMISVWAVLWRLGVTPLSRTRMVITIMSGPGTGIRLATFEFRQTSILPRDVRFFYRRGAAGGNLAHRFRDFIERRPALCCSPFICSAAVRQGFFFTR